MGIPAFDVLKKNNKKIYHQKTKINHFWSQDFI